MTDEPPPDLLAGLHNGTWLDAQEFPPLAYSVPGVIPEGSSMLVGPPKIGKSWFVLGCALPVATGGAVLGALAVEQRPVLYLALEDGHRRLQARCRSLQTPIPEGFEYLVTVRPGTVFLVIEQWLQRHAGAAPLVILDTLGKVMPPSLPGESAYQRDYRVGSELKRLAESHPGMSLLINHHERKASSEDFVDSVSGTHGLAGAADTVISLSRPRQEDDGLLRVTGRDVAEGEYAVTFNQHTGRWTLKGATLADAAAAAAKVRAKTGTAERTSEIVDFVGEHKQGVRAGEVELEFGKDARRTLSRLAADGKLTRAKRGLYVLPSPP